MYLEKKKKFFLKQQILFVKQNIMQGICVWNQQKEQAAQTRENDLSHLWTPLDLCSHITFQETSSDPILPKFQAFPSPPLTSGFPFPLLKSYFSP